MTHELQRTATGRPARAEWVDYFRANRERRLPVPWDEPADFDADELETVIASLRAWQLGESSDAVQLRAMAAQYARDTSDPAFAEAMDLFVAEEQRHGAELGHVLDRAGVPRKTWDFGDAVFRVFRHCLSRMESFVTVVLMVEVLALVYYAAVRRATKCPALRAVCAQILRDEVPHIRFQCERLAQMHRRRGCVGRALTGAAQRFLVAVLAVVSVSVAARADGPPPPPIDSRTPRVRAKLLEDFGSTADTEKAVAAGLAWLAKQQKADGSWAFDGKETKETAAATGLALLAFLGAGESHKDAKGKYKATVQKGLDWLRKDLGANGKFRTGQTMYSHGIAALALVEAYALTFDGALKPSAQACVIFVQRAQAKDGSWGYKEGAPTGDLSIVGWQLQVLHAAKRGKLVVDPKAVKAAVAFLDAVAAGEAKDRYGYTTNAGAQPGTALTAIGLWARANFDDRTADTPGMSAGAKGLLKARPPANQLNFYQLHYATMVRRER